MEEKRRKENQRRVIYKNGEDRSLDEKKREGNEGKYIRREAEKKE